MRLFHLLHDVELFKNCAPGEQLQPRDAAIMLHSGSSAANVGKKPVEASPIISTPVTPAVFATHSRIFEGFLH